MFCLIRNIISARILFIYHVILLLVAIKFKRLAQNCLTQNLKSILLSTDMIHDIYLFEKFTYNFRLLFFGNLQSYYFP